MAGLSRREFLALVATLSAGWGVSYQLLGSALAVPRTAADAPTTLRETVRLGAVQQGQYRTLTSAPGEPYVTRLDVLGREPAAGRVNARRSLAYLGHFSDIHVMDAQAPARLEPMQQQSHSLWAGAFRPQDTLTVHVESAMVAAMAECRTSPLTGAPMTAALVTGDSADMLSNLELRWYIDMLDGVAVTANSGAAGVYEGVQVWGDADYAYHPEDPGADPFGRYGFPTLPGMLSAAVTQEVSSVGLPVPWYSVYGNHDTTFFGTLPVSDAMRAWALGGRKAATMPPLAQDFLRGWAAGASPWQELLQYLSTSLGLQRGVHVVTADPDRKLLDQQEFMSAHFQTRPLPGPVGHGFTRRNLDTGETWWAADLGPFVRAFGLDTCSQVAGPDGAVPEAQFTWLREQLGRAQQDNKLAVVLSHHNSLTLENAAQPVVGGGERLYHADEFIAMLLEFPNCVAWLNGHTHINTIQAHVRPDGSSGFWELTTASCIDYPQQQQLVEIVDNRDGTLSLFSTVVDHASPATWSSGDYSLAGLASLSRELAANDWIENPSMRIGSPLDRNCELLLKAPFDLSTISDADLEKAQAAQRARLVAYEQGRPA